MRPAGRFLVAREGEAAHSEARDRSRAPPDAACRAASSDAAAALSYTALAQARALRLPLLPRRRARPARSRGSGGGWARGRGTEHWPAGGCFTACSSASTSPATARVAARRRVAEAARELGESLGPRECERARGAARDGASADRARGSVWRAAVCGASSPSRSSWRGREPLITGAMDALVRESDGAWLVVDYKSDRVGEAGDLEALVRRRVRSSSA